MYGNGTLCGRSLSLSGGRGTGQPRTDPRSAAETGQNRRKAAEGPWAEEGRHSPPPCPTRRRHTRGRDIDTGITGNTGDTRSSSRRGGGFCGISNFPCPSRVFFFPHPLFSCGKAADDLCKPCGKLQGAGRDLGFSRKKTNFDRGLCRCGENYAVFRWKTRIFPEALVHRRLWISRLYGAFPLTYEGLLHSFSRAFLARSRLFFLMDLEIWKYIQKQTACSV